MSGPHSMTTFESAVSSQQYGRRLSQELSLLFLLPFHKAFQLAGDETFPSPIHSKAPFLCPLGWPPVAAKQSCAEQNVDLQPWLNCVWFLLARVGPLKAGRWLDVLKTLSRLSVFKAWLEGAFPFGTSKKGKKADPSWLGVAKGGELNQLS